MLPPVNYLRSKCNTRAEDYEGGEDDIVKCKINSRVCKRKCCKKFCDTQATQDGLMWNFFMKLYYEVSLEICISVALNLTIISQVHNFNDEVGRVLCFVFIGTFTAFLVFVICFFTCKTKISALERMELYEGRVGALYDGVNYKEHWSNRLVTIIFIVKRVIFVVICFYLQFELVLIFLTLTFLNLLYLLHVQPFEDIGTWKAQVFNEVITWLMVVTLLGYQGDLFDPEE